jgi:ankyrin repeat protein
MRKLLITIGLITGAGSLFAGPIHDAANAGDLEKIKSLVAEGADINSMPADYPWPPLTIAAMGNKINAVDLLIKLGADIDAVDPRGGTPLLAAIESGRAEIAYKLILKGASLDPLRGAQTTPLVEACRYPDRNESIIDLLLLKGVDVNQRDQFGANAIHSIAASRLTEKSTSLLKRLTSEGADINAIASKFKLGASTKTFVTPYDVVGFYGSAAKANLFLEKGAKSAAQLVEDRLSSLEQKVEQGSTGNINPTDEWPRKMWEIDLGDKVNGTWRPEIGSDKSVFITVYIDDEKGSTNLWVSSDGTSINVDALGGASSLIYLSNSSLVLRNSTQHVIGIFRRNGEVIEKHFRKSYISEVGRQSVFDPVVQVSAEGSVITGWDFTPPTLASTDQEGGNNGGNTAMSRLSIGTSGPDISIATDGKLGGPAELQKSNDLKNWRKLGDVPADSAELLITPRDSGNEFFRLKRVGE